MSENIPEPIIAGGPAWLRALRNILLNADVLPPDAESNRARKTFCQRSGEALNVLLRQVVNMTASPKNTADFWSRLHKTTHEGWELMRFSELLCSPWEGQIPAAAMTPSGLARLEGEGVPLSELEVLLT